MTIDKDEASGRITAFPELPRPLLARLAALADIQWVGKDSPALRVAPAASRPKAGGIPR